jgi:hypothetical protein
MSEIKSQELPIPLGNYIDLIKNRRSPYYDVVYHILKDMEMHHKEPGKPFSEVVYTINPRVLQEEIEKTIKDEKLTTVNVCRSILAFLYGSKLTGGKDFYVTTTSGGRKNYHIRVNDETFPKLQNFLFQSRNF